MLRKAASLQAFKARQDTFSLGVCNGCQLMALLGWVNPKVRKSVCLSTVRCATARTATFAEALCDGAARAAARCAAGPHSLGLAPLRRSAAAVRFRDRPALPLRCRSQWRIVHDLACTAARWCARRRSVDSAVDSRSLT